MNEQLDLRQDKSYRRGLVLGLTVAEIMILLIFMLLMALAAALQNRDQRIKMLDTGGTARFVAPVLGWAAVANDVTAQALVLFLIIFVWTPPHFWALALYRVEDYRKSGLPMLPVTHGSEFTRLNILLYTLLLVATTVLPYLIGMSGVFYLLAALVLGGLFLVYAWYLWRDYSDALARKTFGFSIFYLAALFGALLVDHYL